MVLAHETLACSLPVTELHKFIVVTLHEVMSLGTLSSLHYNDLQVQDRPCQEYSDPQVSSLSA